ncbi:MAG: hypothetical protein ACI9MR_000970 [Myxococcota bacterium]|jgi:hypothetical protein
MGGHRRASTTPCVHTGHHVSYRLPLGKSYGEATGRWTRSHNRACGGLTGPVRWSNRHRAPRTSPASSFMPGAAVQYGTEGATSRTRSAVSGSVGARALRPRPRCQRGAAHFGVRLVFALLHDLPHDELHDRRLAGALHDARRGRECDPDLRGRDQRDRKPARRLRSHHARPR